MSAQVPQTAPPVARRADAEGNRTRILAAAREAFMTDGLDVPMRALAARAGVATATLYRHFPSKQELAAATFADEVAACRSIVDDGLAHPDPWLGFRSVIERICDLHLENSGFTAAFMASYPGTVDLAGDRERSIRTLAELVSRAKPTGRLRDDFVMNDFVLVLAAHRGVRARGAAESRAAASRRFAQLVIQAFEVPPTVDARS